LVAQWSVTDSNHVPS